MIRAFLKKMFDPLSAIATLAVIAICGGWYACHVERVERPLREQPPSSLCERRLPIGSILRFVREDYLTGAIRPPRTEDQPENPFKLKLENEYNGGSLLVFRGELELPAALPTTKLSLMLDDEIIIELNGKPVYEMLGERGAMPFEVTLPLEAGRNEILIFYDNLGGLGVLELDHRTTEGVHLPWSCGGKPGFCKEREPLKVGLSYGAFRAALGKAPGKQRQHPFAFVLQGDERDAFLWTGVYLNPSEQPKKVRFNILSDDELAIRLNGQDLQPPKVGTEAPFGSSVVAELRPGENFLELYYANLSGIGHFRFGAKSPGEFLNVPFYCEQ